MAVKPGVLLGVLYIPFVLYWFYAGFLCKAAKLSRQGSGRDATCKLAMGVLILCLNLWLGYRLVTGQTDIDWPFGLAMGILLLCFNLWIGYSLVTGRIDIHWPFGR